MTLACARTFLFFMFSVIYVFKMRGHDKEVVDKILKFFPDFDAFALIPPSMDRRVISKLNQKESQGKIHPLFKKGLKEFQQMLHSKLTPKRSFVGQGFVTGEGWQFFNFFSGLFSTSV